ncbi:hypothetical protein HOY80DRAFT_1105173 [Tuber brumale]|nr:hypothetical protein HOY80DRAFT_1105173 [Tuber brumale]
MALWGGGRVVVVVVVWSVGGGHLLFLYFVCVEGTVLYTILAPKTPSLRIRPSPAYAHQSIIHSPPYLCPSPAGPSPTSIFPMHQDWENRHSHVKYQGRYDLTLHPYIPRNSMPYDWVPGDKWLLAGRGVFTETYPHSRPYIPTILSLLLPPRQPTPTIPGNYRGDDLGICEAMRGAQRGGGGITGRGYRNSEDERTRWLVRAERGNDLHVLGKETMRTPPM